MKISDTKLITDQQGRLRWKDGRFPHEAEKIGVEKWCYSTELYKITKALEDVIEHGLISIYQWDCRIFNFRIFSKFSNLNWFLVNTLKALPLALFLL